MPATTCTAFPQLHAIVAPDAEKQELGIDNFTAAEETILFAWAELLHGYTGHDEIRFHSDAGMIRVQQEAKLVEAEDSHEGVDAACTGVFFEQVGISVLSYGQS